MGFLDVFTNSQMSPVSKTTKVILLTAPVRAVTLKMGMPCHCWYDYKVLGFDVIKESVDIDQLTESKDRVTSVINSEVSDNLGGDYKKLLIGGFSQGAALALYTALEMENEVKAVISFSGHQLYQNISEIKYV